MRRLGRRCVPPGSARAPRYPPLMSRAPLSESIQDYLKSVYKLQVAEGRVALEVIRHHRLLELYLAETLGVDVEDVHDEADRLEHVISEELEARIDRALGYPTHDPHGDPIPDADLKWPGDRRRGARAARAAPRG